MPRQYSKRPIIVPIGPSIAYIALTGEHYALINASWVPVLANTSWHAAWYKTAKTFYAIGWYGNRKQFLHRVILGLGYGNPLKGDHKNSNGLDCRDENLRPANWAQSNRNKRINSNNTSGYKGVSFHKATGKWTARIVVDRKVICLGYFSVKDDARDAYHAAAAEHYGEFARIT